MQEHLPFVHPDLHEHLTNWIISVGAGPIKHFSGSNYLPFCVVHPETSGVGRFGTPSTDKVT